MKKVISILFPLISVALSFSSCSNDDNSSLSQLDKTEVTLYVEETSNLTYSGGDCIWTSDNPLIASVENGVITANHVGETMIHANDAVCKVTVKSNYTKYYDPYTNWGKEKDLVKQYMKNYELQSETDDRLTYQGDNSVLLYTYVFDNGKLNACGFAVDSSDSNYMTNYLLERYIPVANEGNLYTFISPDKQTEIGLEIDETYLLVTCVPASDLDIKRIASDTTNAFSKLNSDIKSAMHK